MSETYPVTIRPANVSDNDLLQVLFEKTAMPDSFSLKTTREDDFFALCSLRGKSEVLVAICGYQLVGSVSWSISRVYVSGEQKEILFLCDFRVHPDFRKTAVALRLYKSLMKSLLNTGIGLSYCITLAHNELMTDFLNSHRHKYPFFLRENLKMVTLLPRKQRDKSPLYPISTGELNDEDAAFLNQQNSQFYLHPVFQADSTNPGLVFRSFSGVKMTSCIYLADMQHYKQDIIEHMPWYMKFLSVVSGFTAGLFSINKLPSAGERIRLLYVRSFAFSGGFEDALTELIREVKCYAFKKGYQLIICGIHDKHPALKLWQNAAFYSYNSHVYFVDNHNDTQMKNCREDVIFQPDIALI